LLQDFALGWLDVDTRDSLVSLLIGPHLVVSGLKDVRLAWVVLALDTLDDPVARTHTVPLLQGVNPPVSMVSLPALLAKTCSRHVRVPVVAHYIALPAIGLTLSPREHTQLTALQAFVVFAVVLGMVTIAVPLMGFDNDWLLAILAHAVLQEVERGGLLARGFTRARSSPVFTR
jgi:hypothetical protein